MNPFIFITYSNHRFAERMDQLLLKADSLGLRSRGYTREWLEQTEFYQQQKHILDQPRGNGYWLWKPYIIYDAVCRANPGDIIFYMDCGDDYHPNLLNLRLTVADRRLLAHRSSRNGLKAKRSSKQARLRTHKSQKSSRSRRSRSTVAYSRKMLLRLL